MSARLKADHQDCFSLLSQQSNTESTRDNPYWTSKRNSLELIELSSRNESSNLVLNIQPTSFHSLSENQSLLAMPPWQNPSLLTAILTSFLMHFVILYFKFTNVSCMFLNHRSLFQVLCLNFKVILLFPDYISYNSSQHDGMDNGVKDFLPSNLTGRNTQVCIKKVNSW